MDPMDRATTIASYEAAAADYARDTAGDDRVLADGLSQLAAAVPHGHVLEIGSGPGWDADALESHGLTVRRTDVTQAFVDGQLARGKQADRLDIVTDDLGGPHDAIMALHVLQHVDTTELRLVLAKVVGALRPGGRFLVSVPLSDGAGSTTEWEVGESGRRYARTVWPQRAFVDELVAAGLSPTWSEQQDGWICVLAQVS